MKTLFDTIAEFVSGDWGADAESAETPNSAFCIRAADVVPIETHDYTTIPERHLAKRSFNLHRLKVGDIVIEKSGGSPVQSTGRVVYVSQSLLTARPNLVCSNFCAAIRLKTGWNPYFVYLYWRQIYNMGVFFNYEGKTSGLKNLQLEVAMKSIPIPEIDLPTQLRIAGVLGSLDEKIELNRKKIAELEALAKTIYDYWFVQFDFPDKNGKPYKSSGGKMVWSDQLKREIPAEWKVHKLPRTADFLFGYPFDATMFNSTGEGTRIVRIRNIKGGISNDFTTEKAPDEYVIHDGDLLVGMDGYFDMNVWVGGDAYLVQRSCRIQAKDKAYQGYLRRFIIPPIKQLEKNLLGATVAHLGKSHLDAVDVIVPPKGISALEMLNALDASIVRCGLEVSELASYRDALLPLLMNGQVVVK